MGMNIRGGFYFKPYVQGSNTRAGNAKPENQGEADKSLHDKAFREADDIYYSRTSDNGADKSLHDQEFRETDKIPSRGLTKADESLYYDLLSDEERKKIDANIRESWQKFNS